MAEKLTITEAAQYLGISRETVRALIKRGKVRAHGDPLDHRKKLIDKSVLQKLKEKSQ